MPERWIRQEIQLHPLPRGCHLITRKVVDALADLGRCEVGMLNVFLQHTSASITINENADPDVRRDLESVLSAVAPEDFPYTHTAEGPDDMPAHFKSSLMGVSLEIPVGDGELLLGTWQGIYLNEHRDEASGRRVILTLRGSFRG